MSRAIILFAHGARDPEWARPFERLRDALEARQPGIPVTLAFLELMNPRLAEAVDAQVAAGATHLDIVPVFMAQGSHLKRDLPLLVNELEISHPGVSFKLQPPVGEAQAVLDAIALHIDASLKPTV